MHKQMYPKICQR